MEQKATLSDQKILSITHYKPITNRKHERYFGCTRTHLKKQSLKNSCSGTAKIRVKIGHNPVRSLSYSY